mmetsp:Transcript_39248/g.63762  ORF Transcript_39248/g.63762 Transcript_39248/m.63762 type:complete len:549 (-) Transcript_39248:1100-2746(-)
MEANWRSITNENLDPDSAYFGEDWQFDEADSDSSVSNSTVEKLELDSQYVQSKSLSTNNATLSFPLCAGSGQTNIGRSLCENETCTGLRSLPSRFCLEHSKAPLREQFYENESSKAEADQAQPRLMATRSSNILLARRRNDVERGLCEKHDCILVCASPSRFCLEHGPGERQCVWKECKNMISVVGETKLCLEHGGSSQCCVDRCLMRRAFPSLSCTLHQSHDAAALCEKTSCNHPSLGYTARCKLHLGRCMFPNCIRFAILTKDLCHGHKRAKLCLSECCTRFAETDSCLCLLHGRRCVVVNCENIVIPSSEYCCMHAEAVSFGSSLEDLVQNRGKPHKRKLTQLEAKMSRMQDELDYLGYENKLVSLSKVKPVSQRTIKRIMNAGKKNKYQAKKKPKLDDGKPKPKRGDLQVKANKLRGRLGRIIVDQKRIIANVNLRTGNAVLFGIETLEKASSSSTGSHLEEAIDRITNLISGHRDYFNQQYEEMLAKDAFESQEQTCLLDLFNRKKLERSLKQENTGGFVEAPDAHHSKRLQEQLCNLIQKLK